MKPIKSSAATASLLLLLVMNAVSCQSVIDKVISPWVKPATNVYYILPSQSLLPECPEGYSTLTLSGPPPKEGQITALSLEHSGIFFMVPPRPNLNVARVCMGKVKDFAPEGFQSLGDTVDIRCTPSTLFSGGVEGPTLLFGFKCASLPPGAGEDEIRKRLKIISFDDAGKWRACEPERIKLDLERRSNGEGSATLGITQGGRYALVYSTEPST